MPFPLYENFGLDFSNSQNPGQALNTDITRARWREYAESTRSFQSPIYPQFKVLRADAVTKNRTLYTYEAHRGKNLGNESTGQYSFTRPYRIPLIEMHRVSDGIALPASRVYGRMVDSRLIKNKETGSAYLSALGEVPDQEAIEEILSGLWLTGSLGSSVSAAHCSICSASLTTRDEVESHPHQRGGFYRTALRGEENDVYGYTQTDHLDKKALLCYTAVDNYKALEYSKVLMPSDVESVIDIVDTRTQPGSHFTGIPYSKAPAPSKDPDESVKNSLESAHTSLWIPMKKSSSTGVSQWGERYVDLVTAKEVSAESLGFLSGLLLYEYVDQIQNPSYVEESSYPSSTVHSPYSLKEESIDCLCKEEKPEVESKLTTKDRSKLKGDQFCGPGRSFPVISKNHYSAALRMLGRYKGPGNKDQIRACIERKGRQNGWA